MASPLIVVAVRTEAAHLGGLDVAFTGIGKVSAAIAVTHAIAERRIGEVVLDPDEPTTLATGDTFVSDPDLRLALAERAHLDDCC